MRSRFSMISSDLKTPRPKKHNRIMMTQFKAPCFRHENSNRLVPRSICCFRFWGLRVVPVHKTKRKTVSFTSLKENNQLKQTLQTSHLKLLFGFLLGITRSYLLKKALNLKKRREHQGFSPPVKLTKVKIAAVIIWVTSTKIPIMIYSG